MIWYFHLIISLLVFPFLLVFFKSEILPALILFSIGSLLPDVDHPKSKIRKIFNFILLILSLIFSLFFVNGLKIGIIEKFVVVILMVVLIFFLFNFLIPKHRGIVHSIIFAFLYGLICHFVGILLFSQSYFIFGFLGYLIHLFLDFFVKI